jgi:hypothetical protein
MVFSNKKVFCDRKSSSYQQHRSLEHTEVSSRLPCPPRQAETASCDQPANWKIRLLLKFILCCFFLWKMCECFTSTIYLVWLNINYIANFLQVKDIIATFDI